VCVACSERVYNLRQAQLLRGHDLSGVWRVCGFEPKTKQQVAIEVSVEHCVCSGKVSGGHVPGGPVEFTLKDGQIVGDQLQWTAM
jgi:hypothetical protein